MSDDRYAPVEKIWSAQPIPPITRIEAERAARALVRHFGRKSLGAVDGQLCDMTGPREIDRSWISLEGGRRDKGWPHMVHDLSHRIWRKRHPRFKPHTKGHDVLERELAEYVVAKGWLNRTLLPKAKRKLTREEKMAKKLVHAEKMLVKWEQRAKLARTKIRKYKREVTRRRRAHIYATNAPISRETNQGESHASA
jgi:hypothetical protein